MSNEPRVHELITLKTIAETLNQSNELSPMLKIVLDKLLGLTGLTTGWIFLTDGRAEYVFAADSGLPPALLHQNKQPMRGGRCWCMDRYRDGRLNNAVNIMGCKRLEDAEEYSWGETYGITHHATVPLRAGSRRVGVLNVGAPGKNHFSEEELALLQSVAFQIGGAIERMRLYAAEQRRSDLFERLGAFSRSLKVAGAAGTDSSRLAEQAVSLIAAHFEWPFAAVMERVGDDFIMRAVYACGKMKSPHSHLGPDAGEWLRGIGRQHRYASRSGQEAAKLISLWGLPPMELSSLLAAPVPDAGLNTPWIIAVGCGPGSGEYEHVDGDALEAIGEHFAVLLESALLEENRRELARLDERNRLARDLHDSVCQMLFSLSMTAKGTESLLGASGQELDAARLAVKDMQSLSQQALKEMRELIMQLRPAGLETGLVAALKAYGEKLGLQVHTRLAGICELPRQIEEALWRIGQEALNNVSKHAGVGAANVSLQLTREEAQLCISDCGRGVSKQREPKEAASIGLHSMRERTEALGGRFTLTSLSEGGTVVEAVIPIPSPNHSS